MKDFKPCPFCGSQQSLAHTIYERFHRGMNETVVELFCGNCIYQIEFPYAGKQTPEYVLNRTRDKWNKRII